MSADGQSIADLYRAIVEDRGDREGLIAFTVEAPVEDPLRLLSAATAPSADVGRDVPAVFWEEKSSPTWVGLRTAFARSVTRQRGVLTLQAEFVERLSDLRTVHVGAPLPWPVRVFGGLAFEHELPEDSGWGAFGAGYFTLPRWTYVSDQRRAWWVVVLSGSGGPLREQAEAVAREGDVWTAALTTPWSAEAPPPLTVSRPGRATWDNGVDTIRDRVRRDLVGKAVLTRDTWVESPVPLDAASSLQRLGHEPTGSVRFSFAPEGRRGPAFIGLTPERLVRLTDHALVTEALAGTATEAEIQDEDPTALLESAKDREEHLHVVRFIMDRLGPLCAQLEHGPPRIRKLRHVTHLKTPITGRLSASLHVLDVVKALHPTPATGGVPLGAARALIKSLEGRPRGWYTGPVGWFDAAGNGDFWVALRSGLLVERQARVFVGAGIVRDSDPSVEWQETLLKERTILSGLGVVG